MDTTRVLAEIDLNAVRRNFMRIKERSQKKVMAVVKADAYGHGALPVSLALCNMADHFAVATIDEAIELREGGIEKPILILGYLSPKYFRELIKYDIEQTIFDLESAKELAKLGGKAHIAVDTGMGRIGFLSDTAGICEMKAVCDMEGLQIKGIFTHFASADEADLSFTKDQLEKFLNVCRALESEGIDIPLKHAANSAAAISLKEYPLDMVRAGIVLYGLTPSSDVENIGLESALSLRSHVVHVKKVPPGTTVSYGRTFVTERESVIATVPVGYADGYPRALSNCGRVVINGKTAPIAGRVCMDQFMVDVTDIGPVNVGDTVYLIDKTVTADEIANLDGTINYETVCKISARVPRAYTGR